MLLHPFCNVKVEGGEWMVSDWLGDKKWSLGNSNPIWETSGRKLRNFLLKSKYFEAILTLMNFAKTEEDFGHLLRVIRNFFSNSDLQTAIDARPKHFCKQLVSSLIVTKKGTLFNKKAVETIFYVTKNQHEKIIPIFCKHLLFEFNFLDKSLLSDSIVSVFFEETTKMFKRKSEFIPGNGL